MLFGLLWMALIIGLPIYLVYWLVARSQTDGPAEDRALVALREQYARGEIDDEEFERRRGRLTANR
jgi:putative membrane protein